MALLASYAFPSALNIRVKQLEHRPPQLHGFLLQLNGHRRRVSPKCGLRTTMAQFHEPNKIKEQLNIVKEKLWERTSDSVKDFPWKKAQNLLLQRLVSVGKKAWKLSLVTFFIFSFLSDFMYSISRNQELMIPFGLLIGCLMTDFLKETSLALLAFRSSQRSDLNMKWQLLAIGGFFVVVKFVSVYFAIQNRVFLSHVGNGGLLQVLWLWKSLLEENGDLFSAQDGSSAAGAES